MDAWIKKRIEFGVLTFVHHLDHAVAQCFKCRVPRCRIEVAGSLDHGDRRVEMLRQLLRFRHGQIRIVVRMEDARLCAVAAYRTPIKRLIGHRMHEWGKLIVRFAERRRHEKRGANRVPLQKFERKRRTQAVTDEDCVRIGLRHQTQYAYRL